jgi:serine phosphatase RsbU (regulator of sigma subunit)/anti-sigma regulatory factor (Ser/Thr protein kinase)
VRTPRTSGAGTLRKRLRLYGVGVLCASTGLGLSAALLTIIEAPVYAPLVGAAALAMYLGGVPAALTAIAAGWGGALWVLTAPRGAFAAGGDDLLRWLVNLLVAVAITAIVWAIERARTVSSRRASAAERSEEEATALRDLAQELSSAVTPVDVAGALVSRVPAMLGAAGGSLGLIDGSDLVVVDPGAGSQAALPSGMRLPLALRAPIVQAAREGTKHVATARAEFERAYPDGARLAPYAAGALAVPLTAGDEVVGSIGFPFEAPGSIDDRVVALAEVAARLGGQALERAMLYERELSLREGFDRIARLAPSFAGASPEALAQAVCREGRSTFGADSAQLWAVGEDSLEVVWRDPPSSHFPPGARAPLDELPALRRALPGSDPIFVDDARDHAEGSLRRRIEQAGTRSVLRVPIVIAGRADRMLSLVWTRVVPAPSEELLLLARRFGDHAGLALEQAERRRAQEEAVRSARETDRLLRATAALAAAATPEQVGAAVLEQAARELGSTAGGLVRPDGEELVTVSVTGYGEELTGRWHRFPATLGVPLADALRRGEMLAFGDRDAFARSYPELAASSGFEAWLTVPLTAGGRRLGALGLSFPTPQDFPRADLDYVAALARQAGQALERVLLLETEQRARVLAEELAADLAQLNAVATALGAASSSAEIARLVCERAAIVSDAAGAAVYLAEPGRGYRLAGSWIASGDPPVERLGEVGTVGVEWLTDERAWSERPALEALRVPGAAATAVVPLQQEGRVMGIFVAWFDPASVPAPADRRLLETMAKQAAQPFERALLLERERDARLEAEMGARRTRALHELAGALAAAATPVRVAEVIAARVASMLSADTVLVYAADAEREHAELLARRGGRPGDGEPDVVPLAGDDAIAQVIARAEPLVVQEPGGVSHCYPLTAGARTLGAVRFSFATPIVLDEDGDATARAVARQGAQALDRSRLFEDERRARMRTERLQALTAAFSGSLTLSEVAATFLDQALAACEADAGSLAVVDHDARELRTVAFRGYPAESMEAWEVVPLSEPHPAALAVQRGNPQWSADDEPGGTPGGDYGAWAVLPLSSAAATVGLATLAWAGGRVLDRDERSFVEALGAQCALALDRAVRYEAERSVAETLQRSVLPETLPSMQGVQVSARYLPGTSAVDVGGDWFDTLTLPDGRVGFVVGDVVGKGVAAAATMAQLRNGMRALTLEDARPAATVTKLNRLLEGITDSPFVTLSYLALDPLTGDATLVSAGHLPLLVIAPDGVCSYLEGGRGLPLGVDSELQYTGWDTRLAPGSTLVLFTDGLVERRDRSIDEGLARLLDVARASDGDPSELADLVVEEMLGTDPRGDDVAVLVVRLDVVPLDTLAHELDPRLDSLDLLRSELEQWLERGAIPVRDARDVLLAAWEAGANAIEHAGLTSEPVAVRAILDGDRVRVTVADRGRWRQSRPRSDRGLGLRMIQALMTQVDIDRSDAGTRVTMERVVTAEPAGSGAADARQG